MESKYLGYSKLIPHARHVGLGTSNRIPILTTRGRIPISPFTFRRLDVWTSGRLGPRPAGYIFMGNFSSRAFVPTAAGAGDPRPLPGRGAAARALGFLGGEKREAATGGLVLGKWGRKLPALVAGWF